MIYELRSYRCVPGRMPALLSRFQNETLRIWEKHGIRQAGLPTDADLSAHRGSPGTSALRTNVSDTTIGLFERDPNG
jgi:hypothetical protein